MHSIPIPDGLYAEAQQRASASGVSLEKFVLEAIQLHLHDDSEEEYPPFEAAQLEVIRRGQGEIKSGKFFTSAQVKADLAANRAAWQEDQP